ncbi:MAG: hypothetical protein A2Y38_18005 [Spirochaetes bacterium GWB1_59_5]|nr:MAG: hypothetical protein A2Y38_18005 [Spirochaetes bacterium GWB1_59_5]
MNITKRIMPSSALALVLLFGTVAGVAVAEDGVALSGYGRAKVGSLLSDGSLFLAETTLDARLSWETEDSALFADVAVNERQGGSPELELRELYFRYSGDYMEMVIGKQQIIWGKSDGVFITDIVTPKDLSRFLVPDFVELRQAVDGVRLGGYAGGHSLELVWLPLFSPGVAPAAGTIWAPVMPYPVTPTITPAAMPELSLENGEYFARYSFLGNAVDLSLMGGWFWNDLPSFAVTGRSLTPGVGLTGIALRGEYYRTAAFGYGVAGTIGPLVLRSEGALQLDRRYQGDFAVYPQGYAAKNAVQYLVGTDFSILGTTFGLQFIQDLILEYDDALVNERYTNTATVMAVRNFAREALRLELLAYLGLDNPDALLKAQLVWKITDAMELSGGTWLFFGDSGQFGQYDDNDSVFAGAKISF